MNIKRFFLLCFFIFIFSIFTDCLIQNNNNKQLNNIINIKKNWFIQSSLKCINKGNIISSLNYQQKDWFKTDIPATILAVLTKNGYYKSAFKAKNLSKIPGNQFKHPWWFRKAFILKKNKNLKNIILILKGINYKADIWLNGNMISSSNKTFGVYRVFKYNISDYIDYGKNVLAIKVYPPEKGELSIGFADWNPEPPDKNMGIWRTVKIKQTGDVSIDNVFIKSKINVETSDKAYLTIISNIKNRCKKSITVKIKFSFKDRTIFKKAYLAPKENKKIISSYKTNSKLIIKNPKLWWPNNLGEQNLHELNVKVFIKNKLSDSLKQKFGIREISDYFNINGQKGFKINGKKILIKGAGWVDDIFLRENIKRLETQIKYAKHINLNTLRLEGFWGASNKLYELADKYGIMIMAGFSCQWEWENLIGKEVDKYGGVKSKKDIALVNNYFKDQLISFRNHPSIITWLFASDKSPRPSLEKKLLSTLKKYDTTRPFLSSASGHKSTITGPTGFKMNGPYDFTPPVYWYEDKKYGGASGFSSEIGVGAQIPEIETIKKIIPDSCLWPINSFWNYHCARNKFDNLYRFTNAINKRYGESNNLKEFLKKAQLTNYELIRPMFESYSVNRYEATGLIQWMFNSAWPSMYWQLYDWYLLPNASFYSVKHACKPVHILYRYLYDDIWVINENFYPIYNLEARIKLFDSFSKFVYQKTINFDIEKNKTKCILKNLSIPKTKNVYFLDLKLFKKQKQIDNNFYWLSTTKDKLNYNKTNWYITPVKNYADFKGLNSLPEANIIAKYSLITKGSKNKLNITLKNLSNKIAFFVTLKIIDCFKNKVIIPVYWEDNYISLLPNELRKIKAVFPKNQSKNDISLIIEGLNTNLIKIDNLTLHKSK